MDGAPPRVSVRSYTSAWRPTCFYCGLPLSIGFWGEVASGVDDELPDAHLFQTAQIFEPLAGDSDFVGAPWDNVELVLNALPPKEIPWTWYEEMIYLLEGLMPQHLSVDQRKRVGLWSHRFELLLDQLYYQDLWGLLPRHVPNLEKKAILEEAHEGILGGHLSGPLTAKKFFQSGLFMWILCALLLSVMYANVLGSKSAKTASSDVSS